MNDKTLFPSTGHEQTRLSFDIDGVCVVLTSPAVSQDSDNSVLDVIHRILLDSYRFV